MDGAVWLSGLMALAGVGFGGLLSARAQDRAFRREERRLWRDARRRTYGEFVAAVRQYRTYVTGPDARIEVWAHPGGGRLVPGIGSEGAACQERMEAAFTAVQMMAPDQETVDKAHLLTSIARRVAVAGAVHGAGQVPGDLDESLFAAERDFLNSVRHDLGLVDLAAVPFPEALARIDAGLMAAYRERIPEHAPE
ncbi:MAG: hypothetical protein ACRDOO_19405 [Actinomadura sp.]